MPDDLLPLVNESGETIGSTPRRLAHGNPDLMHPVVHCIVTNARGDLLLQLRSRTKDVQPGRWDTSVGGHVDLGESIEDAMRRELREEIGIDPDRFPPRRLYRYVMRSDIETELVHSFTCECEGPFRIEPGDIDELQFWTPGQIQAALGTGVFTPNFEDEFRRFSATLA